MESIRKFKLDYLLSLCIMAFVLGGCATTRPLALSSNITAIDVSKESIALLTVKIANDYKPVFQPSLKEIHVRGDGGGKDREQFSFGVDEKYKEIEHTANEYLISIQLPPGNYQLRELSAQTETFPMIGNFTVPVYSNFTIEPHKIIYLGHIEATVKERTDDNLLRAGTVVPLIDQAATGASGGTFQVSITDLYTDDMKCFQEKYPYLAKHQVDNNTLPQWTQPTEIEMQ